MEQRDFLKDQIEQLSRAIAKVFSDFIGWKNQGNINLAIQNLQQALQDELDINLSKLLDLEEGAFINILREKYKINESGLEHLGALFLNIGKSQEMNSTKRLPYLRKALLILEHLQKTSGVYSIDRQFEIDELKKLLLT